MAVEPLTDQEITEIRSMLGHFRGSAVVQDPNVQAEAQAWLRNQANITSPDPTGASVAAAFESAFPGWKVSGPEAIPIISAPGGPATGQYLIYFGQVLSPQAQGALASVAQAQAPPTPAPAVATEGVKPPPGVDPAVLETTPVGGTVTGSDGRTYIKRQDQEMMGPGAPYWLPA